MWCMLHVIVPTNCFGLPAAPLEAVAYVVLILVPRGALHEAKTLSRNEM